MSPGSVSIVILLAYVVLVTALRTPACKTNEDCGSPALCCLRTPPIFRKRFIDYDDGTFHSCSPYLNQTDQCRYAAGSGNSIPDAESYYGFKCPCAEGLVCLDADGEGQHRQRYCRKE